MERLRYGLLLVTLFFSTSCQDIEQKREIYNIYSNGKVVITVETDFEEERFYLVLYNPNKSMVFEKELFSLITVDSVINNSIYATRYVSSTMQDPEILLNRNSPTVTNLGYSDFRLIVNQHKTGGSGLQHVLNLEFLRREKDNAIFMNKTNNKQIVIPTNKVVIRSGQMRLINRKEGLLEFFPIKSFNDSLLNQKYINSFFD